MDTLELANNIIYFLKEDFVIHKLSGNLADTIVLEKENNDYVIKIPALKYDIKLWKDKGVIVYTNEGSYASSVNKYNKNHKEFVSRAIRNGIQKTLESQKIRAEVLYNEIR